MKPSVSGLIAGLVALTLTGTIAATPAKDTTAETVKKITATLHERVPDLHVDQVRPSAFPGMYEVVSGEEIMYSDPRGEHLLLGRLMDTATRENLTEKSWSELHPVDFNSLPLASAIKTVRGDGSRKLAVFADPLCPYCQQLEKQLQSLDNVTIYTFLFPLESVHPGANAQAVKIWCATDPAAAWSDWMVKHADPAPVPATCESNPIALLQAVGQKLKINSTPTLFYADGRRARGTVQLSQVEQALAPTRTAVR
jgi:thiol:disulfide interchange protein DsbC